MLLVNVLPHLTDYLSFDKSLRSSHCFSFERANRLSLQIFCLPLTFQLKGYSCKAAFHRGDTASLCFCGNKVSQFPTRPSRYQQPSPPWILRVWVSMPWPVCQPWSPWWQLTFTHNCRSIIKVTHPAKPITSSPPWLRKPTRWQP